jgi:hypothetical protein
MRIKVKASRRHALPALVAVAIATGGCGGPIKRDELSRGVETLQSYAAEGALLAHEVATDHTKHAFARVHATDLAERADHEAEKLSDAQATPDLAEPKREAVDLAGQISDQLGEIQVHPGDEASGRRAERELQKAADRAGALDDRL